MAAPLAGDETLIAPNEVAANDPDWAWSQEDTAVRMAEPTVPDRQVLGHGDLTTLAVQEEAPVSWRQVWPITAVAAIAAGVVIVMAVYPGAVRNFVQSPQPAATATTTTTTATVTAPPVTETPAPTPTPTVTVTATPTAEAPTGVPAPPTERQQPFLDAMHAQGFVDTPDRQLANGRMACDMLAGPPQQTTLQVARTDANYAPNKMTFAAADAFVNAAAYYLCPQYLTAGERSGSGHV